MLLPDPINIAPEINCTTFKLLFTKALSSNPSRGAICLLTRFSACCISSRWKPYRLCKYECIEFPQTNSIQKLFASCVIMTCDKMRYLCRSKKCACARWVSNFANVTRKSHYASDYSPWELMLDGAIRNISEHKKDLKMQLAFAFFMMEETQRSFILI